MNSLSFPLSFSVNYGPIEFKIVDGNLIVNHISEGRPFGMSFSVALTGRDEYIPRGELAERSNAAVLKTVVLQGTGGSNPSLSDFHSPAPQAHASQILVNCYLSP